MAGAYNVTLLRHSVPPSTFTFRLVSQQSLPTFNSNLIYRCVRYIQVEFELIYALMIFNRVMRLELKKKKLRNFQGFITYSTIKHMLYYILHLKFWSCAGANYAILKVSGFFWFF